MVLLLRHKHETPRSKIRDHPDGVICPHQNPSREIFMPRWGDLSFEIPHYPIPYDDQSEKFNGKPLATDGNGWVTDGKVAVFTTVDVANEIAEKSKQVTDDVYKTLMDSVKDQKKVKFSCTLIKYHPCGPIKEKVCDECQGNCEVECFECGNIYYCKECNGKGVVKTRIRKIMGCRSYKRHDDITSFMAEGYAKTIIDVLDNPIVMQGSSKLDCFVVKKNDKIVAFIMPLREKTDDSHDGSEYEIIA